jgi:hypothetical protein
VADVAHRQAKEPSSQSGAQDVRKTPGKFSKPPPMGAKRKIIARSADQKHKARPK